MLLNLLSNAFKFTPDGGSIVLRAETATREELPEKARSDAGLYPDAALYLRLTLADNGVGMDTRDLERIFDPFYQAQNPDIKSVGTGIGLSLENLGVEISGGDDKFLQQLNEAIDRDIADPALNLDTLCRRIGLSRASLYRKLMSATGLSPARYIQSVRLNLAARMLRETQMSVSEIATASGFNSLIHFSASFRKQYGVPPSRYAAGQEATGPEAAPGRENEPQE